MADSKRRKLALVICNGNYERKQNQLPDARKIGKSMAQNLKKINFKVQEAYDLEKTAFTDTIADFTEQIRNGDLVLFYYYGHGNQSDGTNYLIPIGDKRIGKDIDFEDFSYNISRNARRFREKNPSFATIIILDCPNSYNSNDSNRTAGFKNSGLTEMRPETNTFIHFACAPNQTTDLINNRDKSLFTKYLLNNMITENIHVSDLFDKISNSVAKETNGQQRPSSINGLGRLDKVFLNEVIVIPPEPLEIEEVTTNINEIKKEQANLRSYYKNFVDIKQIIDNHSEPILQAKSLTSTILNTRPTGDVGDSNTACHILYELVNGREQECLFFDSTKGMNLHDASTSLVELGVTERPFVLNLTDANGLGSKTYPLAIQNDPRFFQLINDRIVQGRSHGILEDLKNRLSFAHEVDKNQIEILRAYQGSVNFAYVVKQSKSKTLMGLQSSTEKLKKAFSNMSMARVHPLFHRPSFDISMFDSRGNKQFGATPEKHRVGPPGREKEYRTPISWMRYGLKVLGRYESDAWLHPFQDPGNWYRAYHGTGRAQAVDFGDKTADIPNDFAPVDAMASIHNTGFRPARVTAYGGGVYCSPNPKFPDEQGFVRPVKIKTKRGIVDVRCMLQVAVNPDGVKEGTSDIWVVPEPRNIRPYGMLVKEGPRTTAPAYDEDD